jgi:methylenetetrahydrofolate reductase (NADPH)
MRNKTSASETMRRLLSNARYEVLPTPSIGDKIREFLPAGFTVTVTASQSKGLDATLDLTESLANDGYAAVPHLAARQVGGRSHLEEIIERMTKAGVQTVFVPAGDADPPAGDYHASLDLLEDLKELGSPFPNVGITGYPESHPSISDDLTVQAMWDKRKHATQIVSNMTFDPDAVARWLGRLRLRGVPTPLLVGLPGPVDRAKLLTMATKIGVGESTKFLVKNRRTLTRLAAPGGFTGERFLERTAAALGEPNALVEGLHVFTFNQVAETEQWRTDVLDKLGGPLVAAG